MRKKAAPENFRGRSGGVFLDVASPSPFETLASLALRMRGKDGWSGDRSRMALTGLREFSTSYFPETPGERVARPGASIRIILRQVPALPAVGRDFTKKAGSSDQ
ncbi:hypothetical protein GCM10007417_13090 [Glycocaulis alkaliphilus]|nr:hypothetical protein GCM10007417_13090 [Glycocaulis alkaliphilus]